MGKRYTDHGMMLCRPNGAPFAWAETNDVLIAAFAHFRSIGHHTEAEVRMKAEGWRIRKCEITADFGDEFVKSKETKKVSADDSGEDIPKRRIQFNPRPIT